MIATETGRDNVVPAFLSTHRNRSDVIEGQVFRMKFLATVLACVIIARINIRARKLQAVMVLHSNVLQETDNRRKFDRERDGVNLLIVLLNDLNFSGE